MRRAGCILTPGSLVFRPWLRVEIRLLVAAVNRRASPNPETSVDTPGEFLILGAETVCDSKLERTGHKS